MKTKLSLFLFILFLFTTINSQDKQTIREKTFRHVYNSSTLDFKFTHPPRPIVIEGIQYYYAPYTIQNTNGQIINENNIKAGDIIQKDVYTITGVLADNEYVEKVGGEVKIEKIKKSDDPLEIQTKIKPKELPLAYKGIRNHVRLFVKGHILTEADIRILKRVPYQILVDGNTKYDVLNMKLNTKLPLDVIDFNGNTILKSGDTLTPRNLAILRQIPIAPIHVKRENNINLNIRYFYEPSDKMNCLAGCSETYNIKDAYPGVPFHCGDSEEILAKLGIKRSTINSYYTGEDGVIGCGRKIQTPKASYSTIHDQKILDEIWDASQKTCQFCKTTFKPHEIRNYHKAKIRHPGTGVFYEEKITRFTDKSSIPLGQDTFNLSEIKEFTPAEIECPACSKWLAQDLDFIDLNLHPLSSAEHKIYALQQKIKVGEIKRGVAVFVGISKEMDYAEFVIGGFSTEIYKKLEDGDYIVLDPALVKDTPKEEMFVKKLVVKTKRIGDEFKTHEDDFIIIGSKWKYFRLDIMTNSTNVDELHSNLQ